LTFEHNGRPFTESDVWAITNIGKGTKKEQEDKIGRFGVGFKAVFAYSETPHIWSPSFSFKISELVLPTELEAKPDLGRATRFGFPFNSIKKAPHIAHAEVSEGLQGLAETTLLFLTHLESIQWQIDGHSSGEVKRIQHTDEHIEIHKQAADITAVSHYLRFSDTVRELQKQRVVVAYELDLLPEADAYTRKKPLAKQLKLIPASPGRVSVFFPADKETSGLRFHLHAPFVPDLSRASIKDTDANGPLFEQLAGVAAASLHRIKDTGLLTGEFLNVLPNPQDQIESRYDCIRASIIAEMNEKALTPTHDGFHAPARRLLQGRSAIKKLLTRDDLALLLRDRIIPPQWAVSPAQKHSSNADRFLAGLAIRNWDVAMLVQCLQESAACGDSRKPDKAFLEWLASKSLEWHQQFYVLLREDIPTTPEYKRKLAVERLCNLQIVRLSNSTYSIGRECFFPSDGVTHDETLPRVAKGVYTFGKNKSEQDVAKEFLEAVGVREVGKAEQVQAILKQRYTAKSHLPDKRDLERFVALVEKDAQQAKLFRDFLIFKCADATWRKPVQVFIDAPIQETGLSAFYRTFGGNAPRSQLSAAYENSGVSIPRTRQFTESVGAQVRLEIRKVSCIGNPAVKELINAAPGRWSSRNGINHDFAIENLSSALTAKDVALSRLIWKTLCETKDANWLVAQYRNNQIHPICERPSQLVCMLRDMPWIPQTDGRFVCPAKASRDLLPQGFAVDTKDKWLEAIQFGVEERQRSSDFKKKQASAIDLGFGDLETLERARRFAAIPLSEQNRFFEEVERRYALEVPDNTPKNPERRAELVGQQAAEAQERLTEVRRRTVPIGRDRVKHEAEQSLRQWYTNRDGKMICQICRSELPFKLDDGSYYVEKVQFLNDLNREYPQNYLALCPLHGAMFRYANGSREELKHLFLSMLHFRRTALLGVKLILQ